MKKIISVLVSIALIFSLSGFALAEKNNAVIKPVSSLNEEEKAVKSTIEQFLNRSFQSFVSLEEGNINDITEDNDSTYTYKMFNKQQIELYKEFGISYQWFKLNPCYRSISIKNNQADVKLILDVNYQLTGVDVESGMYGINFDFVLNNKNGIWTISKIDSDYDLFNKFKENIKNEAKQLISGSSIKEAVNKAYQKKIDDFQTMKVQISDAKTEKISKEPSSDVIITATYPYNSSNGVAYATRFVGGDSTSVGDSYTLESAHPYTNNYTNTWTISKTGAVSIRVHFSRISTEDGWDYVTTDAGDEFTGSYDSGVWSSWKQGSSIKVTLNTDSSVTDWGFKIDRIDYRYFYNTELTSPGTWDCTNFVSQCIWAAYGGYVSGNDTQTRTNISNKVRMVNGTYTTGWFGGTGGGSGPWENVGSLWTFATNSSKTYGPNATGINNNAYYNNISPSSVLLGDVLQFYDYDISDYHHSVYVTYKPSSGVTWDNLLVCQHSSDVKNRPVIELINAFGGSSCKMRRMTFSSASFSS